MRSVAICAVFAVLLSACSAPHPISYEDARQVPIDRVFGHVNPDERTAKVSVRRDVGWAGSACLAKLLVNGTPAALVDTGETLTLFVPAGHVVFGAQLNGACAGNLAELARDLVAGRDIGLRISAVQTGDIALYESAPN